MKTGFRSPSQREGRKYQERREEQKTNKGRRLFRRMRMSDSDSGIVVHRLQLGEKERKITVVKWSLETSLLHSIGDGTVRELNGELMRRDSTLRTSGRKYS